MSFHSILKDKLIHTLAKNINISEIKIEVIANEVSLKGSVETYEIKDKIEQIVLSFPEVESVNNELSLFNEN